MFILSRQMVVQFFAVNWQNFIKFVRVIPIAWEEVVVEHFFSFMQINLIYKLIYFFIFFIKLYGIYCS